MSLRYTNELLILELNDERGSSCCATIGLEFPLEKANTIQANRQEEILRKLGSTIYRANNVTTLGEYFIPSSILTDLRRKAIELLDETHKMNYSFDYRNSEDDTIVYPDNVLLHTDNITNKLSESFYKSHGVSNINFAIESLDYKYIGDEVLMHTRYCLLRELGCCRKVNNILPSKLFLVNNKIKLQIETDCSNCEMKIIKS